MGITITLSAKECSVATGAMTTVRSGETVWMQL